MRVGYSIGSGKQQKQTQTTDVDETVTGCPKVRYGAFVPQLQGAAKAIQSQLSNRPIDRCLERR